MHRRLKAALRGASLRLSGQLPAKRTAPPRFSARWRARAPLPAPVRSFALDPTEGGGSSGYWLELAGRCRLRGDTARGLRVGDGISLLAELPIAADGRFRSIVNLADHGPQARLELAVAGAGATRERVGVLDLRIEHPDRAGEDFLQPLPLLSTGRSGTTAVMQLLAALPAVAVRDAYPWECRFGQYQAHAFSVLTRPASGNPAHGVGRYHRDHEQLARNPQALVTDPAFGWYSADYVDVLRQTTTATVEAFYRSAPDVDGENARYFAEKVTPETFSIRAFRSLYEAPRLLFLVRDPRDTMASVLAFNRKRGTDEFGWRAGDTPEEYATRFVSSYRLLHRIWRTVGDRAVLLRYESLMREPEAEIERLTETLGIVLPDRETVSSLAAIVRDRGDRMGHHRTAARAEDSIERWRRDLSPAVAAIFRERISAFLDTFGYPLD